MSLNPQDKKNIFDSKKILQLLYAGWYRQIKEELFKGESLEIGSGFGLAKNFFPCVTSEINKNEFVDRQEDACHLSFEDASLSNIVGIDVLHHLPDFESFMKEANRVLKKGGKIIFVEPYISPISFIFRKLFHHEDLNFREINKSKIDPDDSNLALPTIIFSQQKNKFNEKYPQFQIEKIKKQDCLAYPLSLGYKRYSLVPNFLAQQIFSLEKTLTRLPFLSGIFGYKIFLVVKKI